jgi:hypothetical protein
MWVRADMVADLWAWIVQVGGFVATLGVHVGDVFYGFDVWVEVLGVVEGFGPCLKFLEDREGDSCGEVAEAAVVEVGLVDTSCGNATGCIDDGMELFRWGEVEIQDVALWRSLVAEALVWDLDVFV